MFKCNLTNRLSQPVNNRRGMTLIEIMIVLAIIGSISALLLPRLTGAMDKSKVKEARIQMGQIVNALSMYYTDCGKYPASLENLVTADANCSNWGPDPYLKKAPKDPWQHDFAYELTASEYSLTCYGKDGREGGDGNNKDITLEDIQ